MLAAFRVSRERSDQRRAHRSFAVFGLDGQHDFVHMQSVTSRLENGVSATRVRIGIEKSLFRVAAATNGDVFTRSRLFAGEQCTSTLQSFDVALAALDFALEPGDGCPLCGDRLIDISHSCHGLL